MRPVSEPSIAAFLHYLSECRPDLPNIEGIAPEERASLVQQFESARGGAYDERRWRDFLKDPISNAPRSWLSRLLGDHSSRQRGSYDPLSRYKIVPNKAIFFFTSEDLALRDYIKEHWNALHEATGDFLDIYDYVIDYRRGYQSFTREFVAQLKPIPGANLDAILDVGLPSALLWSDEASVLLPLADVGDDPKRIRRRLRAILELVPRDGPLTQWQVDELESLSVEAADFDAGPNLVAAAEPCDVFLSYRRRDVDVLRNVRRVIESVGLKTWFDAQIPCGDRFRSRIRKQIEAATSTVVCRTPSAVKSPWVQYEAKLAMQLGTAMPLGFNLNTVPLTLSSLNVVMFGSNDFRVENPRARTILDQMCERARTNESIRQDLQRRVLQEAEAKLTQDLSQSEARRQLRRLMKWRATNPGLETDRVGRLISILDTQLKGY